MNNNKGGGGRKENSLTHEAKQEQTRRTKGRGGFHIPIYTSQDDHTVQVKIFLPDIHRQPFLQYRLRSESMHRSKDEQKGGKQGRRTEKEKRRCAPSETKISASLFPQTCARFASILCNHKNSSALAFRTTEEWDRRMGQSQPAQGRQMCFP